MEDAMPNQRGKDGDGEIRDRKNIVQSKGQSFPMSIGPGELSHQKVCIKEKDNERNLDQGAPDPGE
ncbi:MAG: hypothetical protein ABSC77_05200 [Terracidiphilus sp.]|jgi:hypothetical protein